MKNKILLISMAIGLLLSHSTIFAFADEEPLIKDAKNIIQVEENIGNIVEPQMITTSALSFSRQSDSLGTGTLQVISSTVPSSIKATIRLQVAEKDSNTYKNASVSAVTATVTNTRTLTKSFSFKVTTSKKYRVKATVIETVKGNTLTYNYYKKLS